ncbi:phospholipid/cholesterol/gamma-HCH transport system permease protein [Tranquillimonas rosea]|uniref:Phospholipid/cholesterol/gamma-HCH transport system permease protein n=2 Tax=Tranquillimonas rosea TaxID=641238 RepID=A0A1H9PZ28_9RHOB|nr:phospholipid/cholesterol/gamma-HCH transport system permease protein [Tranquillimonas rosea]
MSASPDTAPPSGPAARMTLDGHALRVSGALRIDTVDRMATAQVPDMSGVREIDITALSHVDTAGAWFVLDLQRRAGAAATLRGASPAQAQLIETIRQNMPPDEATVERRAPFGDLLESLGRTSASYARTAVDMTGFLGQVIATLAVLVLRPRRLRLISLVHHMHEVGVRAVPIVALMAFLIGVVLAFQGAAQLRQFGAEVFVVDLISISILRELGILLTAIIVAGRSASAFAAAIGSMKMREEIDAMRTLGLDPISVLVVPRVLALILMLPVLGFLADLAGLIGGGLMSWIELGISPAVFQSRLLSGADVWHYAIGLIKAPFFAVIIGITGCYQGMQVEGNADSLGRMTSASVVLAIFLVIVADAVFSIFFAVLGV